MSGELLTLLKERGIRLSKRSGQHLVMDPTVLERMVEYAELSRDDTVLEIGAGLGNLTELLAARAGKVRAIEKDKRLLDLAMEKLRNQANIKLILGDALKVSLPDFQKVVANIPYSISSDLTFKLLEKRFRLAVLMYQKEFAERLVAKPGSENYGRLTVNVYYRATAELLDDVPPEAFFPQPEITSTIVRIRPRGPPFNVENERVFSSLTRALFQHRRQRVRNALLHSFEEVFPIKGLKKDKRRALVDKALPKELSLNHQICSTPTRGPKVKMLDYNTVMVS
jgi:16S rRNA (adenine1518-N6/adenine1519-N6)-dimethyltransferase